MLSKLRLFTATILLLGAACGATPTVASLDRVELGMSDEEVRRLVGAPRYVEAVACYPDTPVYLVYEREGERNRSYVLLLRSKVARVVRDQQTLVSRPSNELTAACEAPPVPAS